MAYRNFAPCALEIQRVVENGNEFAGHAFFVGESAVREGGRNVDILSVDRQRPIRRLPFFERVLLVDNVVAHFCDFVFQPRRVSVLTFRTRQTAAERVHLLHIFHHAFF